MERQIISVTDIITYLYCPRKLYLRLVKKVKTPPNKAMVSGFLKHKIFDIFNKNESILVSNIKENPTEQNITELYQQYSERISKEIFSNYSNAIKSFCINEEDLLKETLSFLDKDIKLRAKAIKKTLDLGYRGKDLWRNLKPKYLTEFELTSKILGLKGRIDRVKFGEEIEPYEIKTRENIFEEDKVQLAAYSLLLEEEFGKRIGRGIIEVKDREEEIEITEELKNRVLEIAEKIRHMENAEFQNNFKKCKSCDLRKECFEF